MGRAQGTGQAAGGRRQAAGGRDSDSDIDSAPAMPKQAR